YIAKKLFKLFPWLKRRYFWASGLWSPAYYMESVGRDMEFMQGYVMKQKYAVRGTAQLKLTSY
ncbi:MAG: transposase, partial [Nanoarchaeota archaeon]|nr:transposase [Nanoarchaeota archaeon]